MLSEKHLYQEQPHSVQNDAGTVPVNVDTYFLGGDCLRKNNPLVTNDGLLGDGTPLAVLLQDFNMELLHTLAKGMYSCGMTRLSGGTFSSNRELRPTLLTTSFLF